MKKLIITLFLLVLLTACGKTYTGKPYVDGVNLGTAYGQQIGAINNLDSNKDGVLDSSTVDKDFWTVSSTFIIRFK